MALIMPMEACFFFFSQLGIEDICLYIHIYILYIFPHFGMN